jgi:hypothetical protein
MQQYYTSLEIENERYIGVVHNSANNIVEYRTKPHTSQMQAMLEVQNHLKSKQPTEGSITQQQIITNSVIYHTPAPQPKRCCGR